MKYLSRCNPAWLLAAGLLGGCGLIGYDSLPPEPAATETDPATPSGGGTLAQGDGGEGSGGGSVVPMSTGGTSNPAVLSTGGTSDRPPVSATGGGALGTGASVDPLLTGGGAASGGTDNSGGGAASGGSPSTGATPNSGGTSTTGGVTASGGVLVSGGATTSGGMPASGGLTSGGGTMSGGAATSGGSSASGGSASSGGGTASGGTVNSGGAATSGGVTTSGGVQSTGGLPLDAGMPSIDAGMPSIDAGVSWDAGAPPPWDGGGPLDSGTTPLGGVSLANAPLLHRYDFSGVGSVALDLVGNADGLLQGGSTLNGTGQALLDGAGGYVSLPSGMISRLGSATFVAWVDFRGGTCGQHIFDFGSSTGGPGAAGEGISSLHAEMSGCGLLGRPWARYYEAGVNTSSVFSWASVPKGLHMITVVVDRTLPLVSWYIDNLPVLVFPVPFALTDIVDENVWLGRSQWSNDPLLNANYDEFRVYGAALSFGAVQELYNGGPDYLP